MVVALIVGDNVDRALGALSVSSRRRLCPQGAERELTASTVPSGR
ncbi:hypothetical protein I546_1528 [Mycobacterium kansasii 732]|nr:hypothetical protein I546_1528 [Mycobacterium kansasii 732]